MPHTPTHALAIDLGGTRLRVAVVDATGTVLASRRIPTPAAEGPDAVVDAMRAELVRLCDAPGGSPLGPCAGIGIAAPGPLDPATGVVYEIPNLPGWQGFPLVERLAAATGLAVWAHNDANLAGLAEARRGAGRGYDPLIYLTVSTGVGGGVIVGGEMLTGRHGLAGELGHVIVRAGGPVCALGHPGCLEALASGTAIARRAGALIEQHTGAGQASAIPSHLDPGAPITAEVVARAAAAGDPLALGVYHDAGEALGLAIGSFINIFDPARIVIGGGVSRSWQLLEAPMWAAVRQVAMVWDIRPIDILPAALGDDAGLVGAGIYALERWNKLEGTL
jgi:glucokinase